MAKKKVAVLHAQVPFGRGGAEYCAENLVKNLIRRGFDAEYIKLPFKWYPNEVLLDSFLIWRMADITEADGHKIDLVIPMKAPSYVIKHPNKVTWLMHQHRAAYDQKDNEQMSGLNTVPGGDKVIEAITNIDNTTIRESRAIYAHSQNVANRLMRYNGIEATPLYHPPALAERCKAGAFGNYIFCVGRLEKMKREELLIKALPYCDKRIRVKIAGKGPELEPLRKLAQELKVQDRVDLLGFVPDENLPDLYANALAVCYPPVDEDYGYVTLEAFLSQKPVVSCHDSGGVLEFVRDGESGFITDADGEHLGQCFEELYRNKKLARDFGREGYERTKDISWDNLIDELTKTIR